jgi:hypothetical protein
MSAIAPGNVPDYWRSAKLWRTWEAPLNLIKGESFHQKILWSIVGKNDGRCKLIPIKVTLIREPWNEHDKNAVRAEIAGFHVGYVLKELAEYVAVVMDVAKCREFSVAGLIRGGADDAPSLGVHIWLQRRIATGPEFKLTVHENSPCIVPWPPGPHEVLL